MYITFEISGRYLTLPNRLRFNCFHNVMLDACKNTIKPLLRNANLKAKPDKGTMVVDCGIVLLFIKYLLLPTIV